MKEKILIALKTKFKNLGFGDSTFDTVATFLEATVTEETQIDNSVAGVESLLKGFQADADKRVTTAVQKVKTETPPKGGDDKKQEPTMPPTQSDDIPSWAKGLTDTISALTSKINTLESDKTIGTRKQTLEAKLKAANCSEQLQAKILKDFSRMNFDKDEDFAAYLTETEQDVATLAQQTANDSLSAIPKPFMGTVNKDGVSTATAEYLATLGDGSKPAVQGKPLFQ